MFIMSVLSLSRIDGVQLCIYVQHLVWAYIVASVPVFLHKYFIANELESVHGNFAINLVSFSLVISLAYFVANLF